MNFFHYHTIYRQSRKEVYRRSINKYSIFNPLIIVCSCIGIGRYCYYCLWTCRYGYPSRTKKFSDILLKGIMNISFYIGLYKTFLNRLTNFTIRVLYQQHNHLIFRCNIFQYLWCPSLKSLFNDVWSPLFRLMICLQPILRIHYFWTKCDIKLIYLNFPVWTHWYIFLIFASPYRYKNCSRSKVE